MRGCVAILMAVLVLDLLGCAPPTPTPASTPAAKPAPAPVVTPTPAAAPKPAASPADVWPKMLSIGAKSAGSSSYTQAVALFKVIEGATGKKASPAPYATSAGFPKALEDKKLDLAIAGSPNFRWAMEGRGGAKPMTTIRTISTGSAMQWILMVRPDSGINKLADIKGKTIIGKRVGSDMVEAAWGCILAATGLTEKDVNFLPFTSTGEIEDAIHERRVQGAMGWGNSATTYIQEMAAAGDVKLISLTDEEIAKALAKEPGFVPSSLPANTFKGQTQVLRTFGMYTDVATRTTLSDEVVYAVTAAMHDRFKELVGYCPEFKEYALPDSIAPNKLAIPAHNGAVKYFKEKGFWKKAQEDRQAQLVKELKLQ